MNIEKSKMSKKISISKFGLNKGYLTKFKVLKKSGFIYNM
jgi:hypothetical protein